jgi:hypothetical protein
METPPVAQPSVANQAIPLPCSEGLGEAFAARIPLAAALIVFILFISGCAAYRFGSDTLYASDVTTVYVPVVESDSFRRDLGEQLTEAIVKEIERKTPFKVVGTPDADSILAARIMSDRKHVTIENQNDDPRAIEYNLSAQVTWVNRRRQPLAAATTVAIPPELFLPITQTAPLITEAGQSVASQQQVAIQRLAEQIVSTMEEPW